VIHNNGSVSGLLVLVDLATEQVIHKTVVDVEPTGIASDPQGRWLCVVGKRKNRGHVLFWDLATWKKLAGGGAHGRAIDDVCVCPDGTLVATCGADNIIRLWSTANWKTIAKFDEHACEGTGTSGLAWSADGSCLAYANSSGAPPRGGVFVYQRGSSDRQWQLVSAHRGQTSADSGHTRRHLQILGSAAEWIAAQVEKLQSIKQDAAQAAGAATPVPSASVDRAEWLTQFLIENASPEPLANSARVQAWSRTHGIQLPQDYQRFATTVGNKRFRNLMGLEGLDVNIVGPDRLDCESFRRDPPENPEDDPEPDGLLFAIAVNGDCLCFDLRGPAPDYPVVYFDHETETFSPYANTFAAAVHRLASGE
jgi:hypothetical protein